MNYKYWLMACIGVVILEIAAAAQSFFMGMHGVSARWEGQSQPYSRHPSGFRGWSFAVVSVALTPLMIPLAKFLFTPKPHASNVDALIGEKAIVTEPIDENKPGVVKIKGESWRAVTEKVDLRKISGLRLSKLKVLPLS